LGRQAKENGDMAFKGKAPQPGSGEMSKRTEALRPSIMLSPQEITIARRMRRSGAEPDIIAETLKMPLDEVEKALVQMRMPRPESSRGTVNVTLAAHRLIMQERRGNEPLWQTFDRLLDELLSLRSAQPTRPARRIGTTKDNDTPSLPGLLE
jgi:hypothetical protein